MMNKVEPNILDRLLKIDHESIACKLGLTDRAPTLIDEPLLLECLHLVDDLSRKNDEDSKNVVVMITGLLWAHWDERWSGVKDILVLALSRMGFSPSVFMVDRDKDDSGKLSPMQSLFSEMYTAIHQLRCEIQVGQKKYLLTEYQKRIWDSIDANPILGVSAPTSAGKSFIIQLKVIDYLIQKLGNVIYIVPNLSLVSQVSTAFRNLLNEHGITDVGVFNTRLDFDNKAASICVLTQEKALAAFSDDRSALTNVRMLIIDEIQNIEKVADEDDHRAKILYDFIMEFNEIETPDRIIISGPRINAIDHLGSNLFEGVVHDETTHSSPVASITYSISKKAGKYYFNQYCPTTCKQNNLLIPVELAQSLSYYSKSQNKENYFIFLKQIIEGLGDKAINIIFSENPGQANKIASNLVSECKNLSIHEDIEGLIDYLHSSVRSNYSLCDCLLGGTAFHHGKLPMHVRMVVEFAFTRKLIRNMVCTTTLMQGVNLPAQNVIVRTPNLYVKKQYGREPKLSRYEFANLRGRAGRLHEDFLGRCFVLDESKFHEDEEDTQYLFDESYKQLHAGYGEVFSQHRDEIVASSKDSSDTDDINTEDYQYLSIYIKQMILRYKRGALARFRKVGITITEEEFTEISRYLRSLSVDPEVCIKNRYWDPFELDNMYAEMDHLYLVTDHNERDIANRLLSLLQHFKVHHERAYKKSVNEDNDGKLLQLCILAQNWLKEKPLVDILRDKHYDKAENIDDATGLLESKVKFHIPSLLKPLYDMKAPDCLFLRYIETGAYHSLTRRMIEMSIPRETAIRVNRDFLHGVPDDISDSDLRNELSRIVKQLGPWEQCQFGPVLGTSI